MKAAGGGLCWIIQNVRDSYVMADNGIKEAELQLQPLSILGDGSTL